MAYFKEGCRLVLQLVPLISHPLPITHSPQLTYSFLYLPPRLPSPTVSSPLLSSALWLAPQLIAIPLLIYFLSPIVPESLLYKGATPASLSA